MFRQPIVQQHVRRRSRRARHALRDPRIVGGHDIRSANRDDIVIGEPLHEERQPLGIDAHVRVGVGDDVAGGFAEADVAGGGEAGVRGERGPVGPVGPQGPPGPGVDSLDDLGGLACTKAGSAGTTAITVGEDGAVSLRCESPAGGGTGGSTGVIEQGDITLAPSALAFGLVRVGTSLELSVRVTNNRSSTIDEITAVSLSAAFEITNGCGSLAPAASCTIRIRFRPTEMRVYQETLVIGNHAYPAVGQGVS